MFKNPEVKLVSFVSNDMIAGEVGPGGNNGGVSGVTGDD